MMGTMEKKHKARRVLLIILAAAVVITGIVFAVRFIIRARAYDVPPLDEQALSDIGADKCQKLMIVAHPDDETLWGGAHLKEGGYLVVCITNGRNDVRSEEFDTVVRKSGNTPLMLEYPDKVLGKRDDWENVREGIEADLSLIMGYKSWELVATHNSAGEYGHIHHKMTSESVTKVYNSKKPGGQLYYFGKYYKAVDLPAVQDSLERISDSELSFKKELARCYESQSSTVEKLGHMLPYENWTEYSGN